MNRMNELFNLNINQMDTKKTVTIAALFISIFIFFGFRNPRFYYQDFQTSEWIAPLSADKIKNPFVEDKKSVEAGKALYTIYCTPCHGEKGKGDGPASTSIKTKPADHSSQKIQKQSDGAIFWKLTEGRSTLEMVSYKLVLSDKERWSLVNYIRTLSVK